MGADVDDTAAIGGCEVPAVEVLVAARHHDDRALCKRIVDRFLNRLIARTEAAETQVEDLRRRWVGRYARIRSRTPTSCLEHVFEGAAALSQRAHRKDHHAVGHAGDADAVVGVGGDQSRDKEAVKEAVGDGALTVVAPGALVTRIRIAAVAVARAIRVGNEVVSRQHASHEVGMRQDAGIDDRDP